MITKLHNAISKTLGQLNKIIKEKIWGTPRNIEGEEKWVQKREELAKEIRENNYITEVENIEKIRKVSIWIFVLYYFLLFLLRALLFFDPIFLRPLCFFGYPILTYSPFLFY